MAKGRLTDIETVDRSGAGLSEDQKLAKAICNAAFKDASFLANAYNYNASNAMIERDVQAFGGQKKGAGMQSITVDGKSLWVNHQQQQQLVLEIQARQQCNNGMWGSIKGILGEYGIDKLSGSETAALQSELKARLKKLATTGRTSSVGHEADGANVAMENSGNLPSPNFAAAVAAAKTNSRIV